MSSISDKSKTTGEPAEYRLPADGPHRVVKTTVTSEKEKSEQPPYVVAVIKRSPAEEAEQPVKTNKNYSFEELRAKAKAFLKNGNLSHEQKNVLEQILGDDETPKP